MADLQEQQTRIAAGKDQIPKVEKWDRHQRRERWHSFGSVTHANEHGNRDYHRDVGEGRDDLEKGLQERLQLGYEECVFRHQVVGDRDVPGHEHEKNGA